jgi:sRNA-binding protein
MTSPHTIERQRGIREAGQQLEVLRERWPLAFPVQTQDVRPLALGIASRVAETMSWSLPYTLSVLRPWKMAAVYCRAVLSHDQRIALDGTPAETVDAEARDLATKQLARIEARNAAKQTVSAKARPKQPAERPTQLRDQVRAKLLRRRA